MTAATDTRDESRPVPNAAMFRRQVGRPQARQVYTTVPAWTRPTADDLHAMPKGTRRTVAIVPGVFVTLVKTEDGWTLLARHRIPGDALAGLRSAPRVPIDPDELATADAAT